jgi:hypothetical protein
VGGTDPKEDEDEEEEAAEAGAALLLCCFPILIENIRASPRISQSK